MSLFSNAVFTLFVLILLNLVLKRLLPKVALRESDLLVIYIMVVMVSTVSGHRMTRLIGPIVHPFLCFILICINTIHDDSQGKNIVHRDGDSSGDFRPPAIDELLQ